MKRKGIFISFAFASFCLALASCNWFSQKNEKAPELVGKWIVVRKADSSKDSGNSTLLPTTANDSADVTVEFKSDSSMIANKDTSTYYFDSSVHKLFIHGDSTALSLTITKQTDSTIELFSEKDSVFYILQKKK